MVTTRKVPSTSHVSEHQGEDLIKDYFNKSSPSNLVLKLPKPVIDSDPVTNVFKSAFHNNRNVEYSAETSNSKLGIRSSHVSKIEHHAEGLIKDYLSFDKYSPYDLVLKLPEAVIDSEPVSNVVTLALHSKRKVEYNAETSILRILAMSRPVHDVIAMLVSRFLMKATSSGFLTSEEIDYVSCGHEGVPPQTPGHRTKRKPIARIKYPDSTIFFGNPDSKPIPRIVFKVGLSQLYEDLVSDAKQWLERSGGRVKVVIIVDIKETRIRRTDDTKERIKSLVATYGNNVARARYDLDVDVPDSESTALYEEVENLVKVEDWVGDLKAVLEVWQFSKDKFNIRQRVTILPPPGTQECPVIKIADIIPEEHWGSFKNFDKTRTAELDMTQYRRLLVAAKERLAYLRAMSHLRPQNKNYKGVNRSRAPGAIRPGGPTRPLPGFLSRPLIRGLSTVLPILALSVFPALPVL